MRSLDPGIRGMCLCVRRRGPRAEILGILEAGVECGVERPRTPIELGCPGAGWEDRGLGVFRKFGTQDLES